MKAFNECPPQRYLRSFITARGVRASIRLFSIVGVVRPALILYGFSLPSCAFLRNLSINSRSCHPFLPPILISHVNHPPLPPHPLPAPHLSWRGPPRPPLSAAQAELCEAGIGTNLFCYKSITLGNGKVFSLLFSLAGKRQRTSLIRRRREWRCGAWPGGRYKVADCL